jgi:hypothetical protein
MPPPEFADEETASGCGGWLEYIEKNNRDSRQGLVLLLGGWKSPKISSP